MASLKQRYYKPIVKPLADAITKISSVSRSDENIKQQNLDTVRVVETEIQKKEIDWTTLLHSPNGHALIEYYLQ